MALMTQRRRNRPARTGRRNREELSPLSLRNEIDRLFDDFFTGLDHPIATPGMRDMLEEFVPSVDMTDKDGEVEVTAELPGMTEDDVTVELNEDVLTLSGEKKEENEDEEEGRRYRESSYGSFVREIPLPSAVDGSKTEARFKNGVLRITLPKMEKEEDSRKKIEIKS
jgi:HSP20 family protein